VPLGTAGAVGQLRDWLAGRAVLVANSDTWHRVELRPFVDAWDHERVGVLTTSTLPFGPGSAVVASLMPWSVASTLTAEPSGLWEAVWRDELDAGRLDVHFVDADVVDCGTPADYLRANLAWSGGASVVGEGAEVLGTTERAVVWAGARVRRGERLVHAIRTPSRTVLVR
jgi:NDP-sugar pyrophosphorylase family protein